MTILFTSAKFHFYHHGATSISDSFFSSSEKMRRTRPWVWGLRVCSWTAHRGDETWWESQPGRWQWGKWLSSWFPQRKTSSQAAPFGKTSSQLTRTVDKSTRSVSGAPLTLASVLKSNSIVNFQVTVTHEPLTLASVLKSNSVINFQVYLPMNGLRLGFQQKAWAQPARWESSVTRTSNSVTAIIPRELLYFENFYTFYLNSSFPPVDLCTTNAEICLAAVKDVFCLDYIESGEPRLGGSRCMDKRS